MTAEEKLRRVTWRAGRDRVAHGHYPLCLRTLCGERIVTENLAWPKARTCAMCQAALEPDGLAL